MTFPGFRDFRTDAPKELRQDLQRLNALIERAFADVASEQAQRFRPMLVTGPTGSAAHGDLVVAGFTQAATIFLPASTAETAGRVVRVAQSSNTVTVIARQGQTVAGGASTTIGTNGVYKDFIDDGAGHFWGPA